MTVDKALRKLQFVTRRRAKAPLTCEIEKLSLFYFLRDSSCRSVNTNYTFFHKFAGTQNSFAEGYFSFRAVLTSVGYGGTTV